MDLSGREEVALRHIRRFVRHARELVEGIRVEHLIDEGGLNPYMIAALGIDRIEDAVELFVYRRVERSLGTSFGTVIESFLRDLLGGVKGSAHPACSRGRRGWVCWWDIVIEDRKIVLAVKSGPANINKDIVERFIQHAEEAEQHGYRPFLVLTYGKRAFNVAESTLRDHGLDPKEYLLVGRGIFEYFFGDPGYYDRIIELISREGGGIELFNLIDRKIKELSAALKQIYGDDVERLLKDLS